MTDARTEGVKPKYAEGDRVKSSLDPEKVLTVRGVPQWNGYNYVYAFNEIDLKCSEGRLSLAVEMQVP